jgi:hypothetical protein
MAEPIVDVLEAVEIHDQDRDADRRTGVGQRVVELTEERPAVREPGQRVVDRLVRALERLTRRAEHEQGRDGQQRDEHEAEVDRDHPDRCE